MCKSAKQNSVSVKNFIQKLKTDKIPIEIMDTYGNHEVEVLVACDCGAMVYIAISKVF
uniref:Putative LOC100904273 [Metaseiulus occidentalis] n=1 Tax=Lepeophtheirus salmonis TaxID=72036 RepID=A0A0K2U804_LEPSM